MAIIPSSTQFIGIAASVNLTEKKSSQLNSETQPYTMQDIIDTAGGGGTPAGTAGQIQFNSGSAFAADSNLFWDNTNKYLGVGTATPSTKITAQTTTAADGISLKDATNSLALLGKWFDSSGFIDLNQSGTPYTRIQASQSYINTPLTIGTATAISARLAVKGSGSTSATTSLLVQNSSGTQLLATTDDGKTTMSSAKIGSIEIAFASITRPTGDTIFFSTNKLVVGSTNQYSSAQLAVDSTNSGFLPPRMTTTQKNAISSPAEGLMVMDITTHKLCVYDGTSWVDLH